MDVHFERRRGPSGDVQPLRLLIVDDDPHYRAWLAALTERAGFTVDAAADGETGLAMLAGGAYDVAVIDHEMPRVTGIDVVRALRSEQATQAIYALMLTAHDDMETKLAALAAGFDDFVPKSSAEAEIVAKIVAAQRIAARQRTLDVAIRELYGLAIRDELTGVFNRRFFIAETERLLASGVLVSLILFDLDGFKQINDTHGHVTGDSVLRDIGALFHHSTRPEDILARFGGDEFVMAIPQVEIAAIERMARRLAGKVEALRWTVGEATFGIGMSTGIASSRFLAQPSLAQLINTADRDMYKNKWLRRRGERPSVARKSDARVEI